MPARLLRKRRGRKPKWQLACPRRPTCRDCPFRKLGPQCPHDGLWSGRCGDWVWYVRHGKQFRRLWVKPHDPHTPSQRRQRARLGAISAAYSAGLTEAQYDACIAAGAKRRCRPRLGVSGTHTGQQYWVHQELKGKPARKHQFVPRKMQVPKRQRLRKKYKSQVPPPREDTRTTWDPHRLPSGSTPAPHRGAKGLRGKPCASAQGASDKTQAAEPAPEAPKVQHLKTTTRPPLLLSRSTAPIARRFLRRGHRERGVARFTQGP